MCAACSHLNVSFFRDETEHLAKPVWEAEKLFDQNVRRDDEIQQHVAVVTNVRLLCAHTR